MDCVNRGDQNRVMEAYFSNVAHIKMLQEGFLSVDDFSTVGIYGNADNEIVESGVLCHLCWRNNGIHWPIWDAGDYHYS